MLGLWTPTKERIQTTLMYEFTNIVNKKHSDVKNVYDWSINEPNQFWSLLWDYLKIKGTKGERIYVPHKNGQYLPQAQFFVDSQLNISKIFSI
jgi:acetoacetyl-CoA synthetase